ncbi:hypothetical protein VN97_g3357 [Penicillium thymicola]|uniref:Uncharacterized protein n=1 Tax=Penicillium thymicola TaxID=293382 RepID=A0AAI9TM95_PENTH|nr:hypothetical protein VN97_g3357 [Penicillium thymicola]
MLAIDHNHDNEHNNKDEKNRQKRSASSVNRTRASSMATTNSTTRPMMLVDIRVPYITHYKYILMLGLL